MLRFGQSCPRAGSIALPLVAALGAFLSGCGFAKFEQREPWRAEAEAACMKSGIVQTSQWIRPTKPIDGPGVCGLDLPLKVAAFPIDPQTVSSFASMQMPRLPPARVDITVLKPESAMTCPMVAWTDDWVNGAVQPAAQAWFGQGVSEIRTAGTYSCRRRNHNPGARLSEHAFGNAIDVMSFVLADGNVVTVKGGWRGSQQEQGFLRDVLHAACQRFKTVLGPGSDALHYDHFHFDLARHDPRGTRRYCRPRIDAPERPIAGAFGAQMPPSQSQFGGPMARQNFGAPVPRQGMPQIGQQQPLEVEEDFDPKDFDITSSLDLPRPRRGMLNQPLPEASPGLQTQRSAPQPAPAAPASGSPMRPGLAGQTY